MQVKFYLKRPNPPGKKAKKNAKERGTPLPKFDINKLTAVIAVAYYNGKTVKVGTGESILPKYWNAEKQCARTTQSFREHPEFNKRLTNIASTINIVLMSYKDNTDHELPTPDIFRGLIITALKKKQERQSFIQYFEDFANRTVNGEREKKGGKGGKVQSSVGKGYFTTLNHLIKYRDEKKKPVDFANINLSFHKEFTQYLEGLKLSVNTIGTTFKRIKVVLNEATTKKIKIHDEFNSDDFSKRSELADTHYLTVTEIKAIQDLDLSKNERLDNVRDMLLILCDTGQRISDFYKLKPESPEADFVTVTQSKGSKRVTIPVTETFRQILRKRNGELPPRISDQRFNDYIKEVGKMVPMLHEKVSTTREQGGLKVTVIEEKYKKISSHIGRRSFSTNEYLRKTALWIIKGITGHKSETELRVYLRIGDKDAAEQLKTIIDARAENLLKAVG